MKKFIVVLAVFLGLLGVVSVSSASIPSDGIIYGCYKNSNGSVKIIDNSTQSCGGGETSINWPSEIPTTTTTSPPSSTYIIKRSGQITVPANTTGWGLFIDCPPNYIVVNGGYDASYGINVFQEYPSVIDTPSPDSPGTLEAAPTRWNVVFSSSLSYDIDVSLWATCLQL